MSKQLISRASYTLACALAFCPAAARADSVPTITVTSASGYAYFGGGPPQCGGVCFYLSNPTFSVSFSGFVPFPYYQATPGDPFEGDSALFNSGEAFGAPSFPTGSYIFDGVSYPAIFGYLQVTGEESFIVPYAGTAEIPAVLTGSGTVCNGINPFYNCSPSSGDPNPVLIANLNVDIPGYLTFDFYSYSGVAPNVLYVAKFTPVPEPSTFPLLLTALAAIAAWRFRNHLRLPLTCFLLGGALIVGPSALRADSLPNIVITSATGFASWSNYSNGCPGICASFSAPDFTLNFQSYIPYPGYSESPGDPLMTLFALTERSGAPAVPNATVTIGGSTYPVAFPDGSISLIASTIIVPSGDATIQLFTFLTGTGTACTATYGIYGCLPPPGTVPYPQQIADVSLDLEGYLTLIFRPGPGPAQVNEDFTATFTPIPEAKPSLLLLAAFAAFMSWRPTKERAERRCLPAR